MITTAQKIALATIAYRLVALGRGMLGLSHQVETTRGGVRWSLDLREGIDFSIFALGGFEPVTLNLYRTLVTSGSVVLDIGANIGSHTLPLATLVGPCGRVIAFEPTEFAIKKLRANTALNPELAQRINAYQLMLVADSADLLEPAIYSSWPLSDVEGLHEKHRGKMMSTTGARSVTLDQFVVETELEAVHFIKIDVDGNEPAVLTGGSETLRRFRPQILMEFAPYLFKDDLDGFENMLRLLDELGYAFIDANTGKPLPKDASSLFRQIPDGASRNVLLRVD